MVSLLRTLGLLYLEDGGRSTRQQLRDEKTTWVGKINRNQSGRGQNCSSMERQVGYKIVVKNSNCAFERGGLTLQVAVIWLVSVYSSFAFGL